MQNFVFVLDSECQPLSPCHPARARELLRKGKAAVFRRFPFTIILKRAVEDPAPEPIRLKIDPGSKTTGIALVQAGKVIFAAELIHRGQSIRDALEKRGTVRRNRRSRKTRYRRPGFQAGQRETPGRPKGWLSPSLQSRVDNLRTWFLRLFKLAPITSVSLELVRFDTQLMQNAEISGVEYQQGELTGYEVREYLLEKFGRRCVYCKAENVLLQVEHINPRGQGGSNRVSNLTLACESCNKAKGNQTAAEFGHPAVQALAKQSLKDAAAVNSVRWAIWRMLDATGLPVEVGTGGRTKYNRTRQGRRMVNRDKAGFPRGKPKQFKRVHGFQTGDMVKAIVPGGKYKGSHQGKVNVRTNGSFKINRIDINWKYCVSIWRSDGYSYECPA
jgi:5-methylcytosine-specific restriction endonuclease McrA